MYRDSGFFSGFEYHNMMDGVRYDVAIGWIIRNCQKRILLWCLYRVTEVRNGYLSCIGPSTCAMCYVLCDICYVELLN